MAPGLSFGEALLAPTVLYSPVTEALYKDGIVPHYAANVTGHGWRKLMRHERELTYRIHTLPPVPEVLRFIQQQAAMSDEDAYGTLNMGAGFALYVDATQADRTVEVAQACGVPAWRAGQVESGRKRVVVEPLQLSFEGASLQLR